MTRTWTVRIDAPTTVTRTGARKTLWLNANDQRHWSQRARITKAWRNAAQFAARRAAIPPLDRAHVTATIHKTRGGRYDPANLYPCIKAAIDGALVDTNVLIDDDHEHLTGPDMRAGTVDPVPHITLTITEL